MQHLLLLPGSRRSEIERLMHPMLSTVAALYQRHPGLRFAVSAPREKIKLMIEESCAAFRNEHPDVKLPPLEISSGDTARWLQEAGTGLAASGTVTVECGIAGLPLVVIYKISPLTFFLAKHIIRIKLFRNFFTMVNIIAEKEVYQEFLQEKVTVENMLAAVERILPGGERRALVESEIERVSNLLAVGTGSQCRSAASAVADFLSNPPNPA